jgi:hypothetical protein
VANRNPYKARLSKALRNAPGDLDSAKRRTWGILCLAYDEVASVDLGSIDSPDAKFVESAAVVSLLDAVVCIDSSLAHLSGALGKRCFLMLGVVHNPRWGSAPWRPAPWYPETIMRQTRGVDGSGVTRWQELQVALWRHLVENLRWELEGCVVKTLARRGVAV